jgi:hypothetical protein
MYYDMGGAFSINEGDGDILLKNCGLQAWK